MTNTDETVVYETDYGFSCEVRRRPRREHINNTNIERMELFAAKTYFVGIVIMLVVLTVSLAVAVVLQIDPTDVAQEMVRVHEMREAYWR